MLTGYGNYHSIKILGQFNKEVRSEKTYLRLRSGITKAIRHRKSEGLPRNVSCEQLRKHILNEERNEAPAMKETGILTEMQSAMNRVAHHTNSLIEDVDNNCVEQFNSLVAKTIGEKRINFSMRHSFQVTPGRSQCAVVAHNSKSALHRLVHKTLTNRSPGVFTKKYIAQNRPSIKLRQCRKKSVAKGSLKYSSTGPDEH
ncbi:hypothetical protein PR048_002490 [Dryococelus australis]|uniref:Uncharacterized protein n=1 Tax=Dryococelus australis TaxID=614101 RepID=A0ABQ9ILR8_9NEOP|nr:hypothetical protein PR048_002490 [Dryococelus australis]